MVEMPAPGGASLSGWRVSRANTAGFGWEANEVRWAGTRIMSGGNSERIPALQAGDHDKKHERSEYRSVLERQEFVVRNGASAEWRMTISERK